MGMHTRKILACAIVSCLWAPVAMAGDLAPVSRTVIADEGTLGTHWQLARDGSLAMAAYPVAFAGRGDDVCLALGYRIGEDGETSDFAVLKQWNSATGEFAAAPGYWEAFAGSAADAISQWRFAPRADAGPVRETYTVATIAFTGAEGAVASDIRAHCRVGDLTAFLQDRGSRYLRDSSIIGREMQRNRRTAEAQRSASLAARASHYFDRNPGGG